MIGAMLPCLGGFVRLDDFEDLAPGLVHGQAGWVSNTDAAEVVEDPTLPGNRVLRLGAVNSVVSVYKPATIAYPAKGTLFFRMYRGGKLNVSVGLSDVSSPGNNSFPNYEAQVNSIAETGDNLRLRHGNNFVEAGTFPAGEWLHMWIAVDTGANTYVVYRQTAADASPRQLSAGSLSEFTFRNSGFAHQTNDLVNLLVMCGDGDGGHSGPFLLDDFYLDAEAVNLSHPTQEEDTTAPAIASIDPPPGPVGGLEEITVSWDEPVRGVEADDLRVNGVPALSVSGSGTTWTFQIEQPPYGNVEVAWNPAHEIEDHALPANRFDESAAGWSYALSDGTPPQVVALDPPADSAVPTLTQVTVTFSEPVTGVDAADLRVGGNPAYGHVSLDDRTSVFEFAEPPAGAVDFSWSATHEIADLAGNAFAGSGWAVHLDPQMEFRVRINEILASNRNGLQDEDGEAPDWIELFNEGDVTINLGGWSLSDDPGLPDQWILPAVSLEPGEFLVVFASGKDRTGGPLHTNFRLGADGEFLGLYAPGTPRTLVSAFDPAFPTQRTDFSYGLSGEDGWRYFETPTPGAPNGTSTITGIVEPPVPGTPRGLHSEAFDLTLASPTPDATVRYTLDGSEPNASSPALAGSTLRIEGTTVLRAAAFKAGALPSEPVTATYLFPAQIIRQPADPEGFPATWGSAPNFTDNIVSAHYAMYPGLVDHPDYADRIEDAITALPALSLVMDVDDMFGEQNGIYTHSRENVNLFRGIEWERPVSLELIDGATSFQAHAGIRIHGNASREPAKTPKHSFRLFFRGDYGAGELEERVFPDSPVDEFNQLVLRADFNNSWLHWNSGQRTRGTRIRDGWAKETWRDMGHVGSRSRYVNLFINGLYWGVYDIGERIDAAFASTYLGGEREDWDAMASKPTKAIDGDRTAYDAMLAAADTLDMSQPASFQAMAQHLDLDNFIDYMLLNFFAGNEDWGFDSNWNAIRSRLPGGRYLYLPWDAEMIFGSVTYNRVTNSSVPSGLHTRLIQNAEYRLAFADRVRKHVSHGGALTVDANRARWQKHADTIAEAIVAESARWGNYRRDVHSWSSGPYQWYTPNTHWNQEIARVRDDYLPQRGNIVLQQLRSAGLYPAVEPPAMSRYGDVREGETVDLSAPAGTIWFTLDGTDPRVFGTGAVAPGASTWNGPLTVSSDITLKARVLHNGEWSALTSSLLRVALPHPHPLAEGPYHLAAWPASSPAGSYPEHMMFYQTPLQDPPLEAPTPDPWRHAYNLGNRSRINGLGTDGFSFINTGSAQDVGGGFLGSAVLALDTTGITETIQLFFTAGTVTPNNRVQAVRLQYRIGQSGAFHDLPGPGGSAVEYVSQPQSGHSEFFGPVELPAEAADQPVVELRWKYHHVSGDSGPRAEIRVSGIFVAAGDLAPRLVLAPAGPTAQSGRPLAPVIARVEIVPGMPETDFTGEVTLASATGGLSGTLTRAATAGVAIFDDLAFATHGSHTLTASAAGISGTAETVVETVALSEEVVPLFIQGASPTNNDRVPFAFRVRFDGLKPQAIYRYANRMVLPGEPATQDGAGNMTFVPRDGGAFVRSTSSPDFSAAALHTGHGEFETDASGSFAGWFVTEPSGNARFASGGTLHPRLLLNDGDGGETIHHSLTAAGEISVIAFGGASNQGSAVYGTSSAAPRNFILLFGEDPDRPLAATPVETTGALTDTRYAEFYRTSVAATPGRWGTILPNGLPALARIEERHATTGTTVHTVAGPFHPTAQLAGGLPLGLAVPAANADSFTRWQARQFPLADLENPALSGPDATPRGDGLSNFLRHALALELSDPATAALPRSWIETRDGETFLVFQHRRLPAGAHDLSYLIERSQRLTDDWDDIRSVLPPPDIETGAGFETLTWRVPLSAPAGFLRLHVAQSP